MSRPRPREVQEPLRAAARFALAAAWLLAAAQTRAQTTSTERDTDRIDITGRQNLTLGSGARAYGMGGAFLARADDATAASWNPAGLSYLRQPEVSVVGALNAFDISRGLDTDTFRGHTVDFAAFTWPVALGSTRGAVQLSYQRAVSFDGRRTISAYQSGALDSRDLIQSNGGFDVVALGTGLRLTRSLRAGFTANRWVSGYDQTLQRTFYSERSHPYREFYTKFQPQGWSFNLGLMWSPIESLNVGAVYKTPFRADVKLAKTRADSWGTLDNIVDVTTNAFTSLAVQLDFPASCGLGLSWRPRDTLTLSADFTLTRWSQAQIFDYFDLRYTDRSLNGIAAVKPPPTLYPVLQYPGLTAVPTSSDPRDPARLAAQRDKQELRAGVEWVLIKGRWKVPLRTGYFSDRQISPDLSGGTPRFNGFTAGAGIVLGSVLLDVAYLHEFGKYYVDTGASVAASDLDTPTTSTTPQRNSLTTNRVFASIIYRFGGHP
jgi:hypothetical protein